MRTAKPCGPGAPRLASSLRSYSQATEATTPGLRGERGGNRKTIAQGVPECFGVPVVTKARVVLFIPTRGYGCGKHPAFPAPSSIEGRCSYNNSGASAPRECGCAPAELFDK